MARAGFQPCQIGPLHRCPTRMASRALAVWRRRLVVASGETVLVEFRGARCPKGRLLDKRRIVRYRDKFFFCETDQRPIMRLVPSAPHGMMVAYPKWLTLLQIRLSTSIDDTHRMMASHHRIHDLGQKIYSKPLKLALM